jgi:hypothetical protein
LLSIGIAMSIHSKRDKAMANAAVVSDEDNRYGCLLRVDRSRRVVCLLLPVVLGSRATSNRLEKNWGKVPKPFASRS